MAKKYGKLKCTTDQEFQTTRIKQNHLDETIPEHKLRERKTISTGMQG